MVSVNLRKFGKTTKNANYIHNYIQIAFRKWLFNTSKNDHLQFEHGWFFSFYVHSENFIALSTRQSENQKTLSKKSGFHKQIV